MRLNEVVSGERPEIWTNKRFLHYDNDPAYSVLSQHPTYSLDLAPTTFGSFHLEGMNISAHQNIQKYVTALLVIPKEELYECLQQQQHCWAKCTVAERDYTEGDLSHDALSI